MISSKEHIILYKVSHPVRISVVVRSQEVMQSVQWPLFCHCRANTVEESVWTASTTGHLLWTV